MKIGASINFNRDTAILVILCNDDTSVNKMALTISQTKQAEIGRQNK